MAEKKLSKKALNSGFHRWYYGNLTCFSQEHMQTFGYLCSMLPLCKELYADDPDKMAESMDTYRTFFNTEPQLGAIIVGVTAGLEEARANGAEDVDSETINGLRAGLMGPIAGIGDSLVVGTVIPILLGIAMGMSGGGSPMGAIFYIIVWNLFAYFGMRFLYFKGYDMGTKAVEFLVGDIGNAIREAVTTLGGIVIGAVSASFSEYSLPFTYSGLDSKSTPADVIDKLGAPNSTINLSSDNDGSIIELVYTKTSKEDDVVTDVNLLIDLRYDADKNDASISSVDINTISYKA